jgi:hypothetical protein
MLERFGDTITVDVSFDGNMHPDERIVWIGSDDFDAHRFSLLCGLDENGSFDETTEFVPYGTPLLYSSSISKGLAKDIRASCPLLYHLYLNIDAALYLKRFPAPL